MTNRCSHYTTEIAQRPISSWWNESMGIHDPPQSHVWSKKLRQMNVWTFPLNIFFLQWLTTCHWNCGKWNIAWLGHYGLPLLCLGGNNNLKVCFDFPAPLLLFFGGLDFFISLLNISVIKPWCVTFFFQHSLWCRLTNHQQKLLRFFLLYRTPFLNKTTTKKCTFSFPQSFVLRCMLLASFSLILQI